MKLGLKTWMAIAVVALSTVRICAAPPSDAELVYVGSGSKDIFAFWLDPATGALSPIGDVAKLPAPSFLAVSPDQHFLYSVSEGQSKEASQVSGFRTDPLTGNLAFINSQPSGGAGPCYVDVDHAGMNVLVANYNSGSVSVFHLDKSGALGPASAFVQDSGSSVNRQRQEGPHAHCIVTDPADHYAFFCDLGIDKVMSCKFDPATGSLTANDPAFASVKPGNGPRHIVFHPNGHFAYVIDEMASAVTVFGYDSEHGILSQIEEQPLLPPTFTGMNTAAEIVVHPNGKFVYASNRGDNSIVVFACDPATGRLTFVERDSCGGKIPRGLTLDPSGSFLLAANQRSGAIVVFRVDSQTGRLQQIGSAGGLSAPECVTCLVHTNP